MTHFDSELSCLHEAVARCRRLEKERVELLGQVDELSRLASELEAVKLEEEADVDRLEGKTLAAFFFNLVGNIDEKLDKERREAYAARTKYDTVVRELMAAKEDLRSREEELQKLSNSREQYAALLAEKKRAVKAAGGEEGRRILEMEEEIAALASRDHEILEAVSACTTAQDAADLVLKHLSGAEGWSTWDMVSDSVFADIAKHSALDDAQRAAEELQGCLRRLKTELADVDIRADMQINIDGFQLFADYVIDNFFTDLSVMDKIHQAQEKMNRTANQLERLAERLYSDHERVVMESEEIRDQMDALVRGAAVPTAE